VKHLQTLGAVFVALVLVGTLVAVAGSARPSFTAKALTPESQYTGTKSVSGALAKTDKSLLGRTDATPVNVLIKYDFDAIASYTGGVAGLAATSPAATGKKLKANKAAVRAYEQHAAKVSKVTSLAVQQAVPGVTIKQSFETAFGGVAATVPANKISDLLEVDGVVAVQKDTPNRPLTDATPQFIGATAVWPSIGGPVHGGENVVVGVIDTGIWPEHPSFDDHGLPAPPGGPYGCEFGDGSDVAHLGDAFTCNNKLVGSYAFTDTYLDVIGAEPGEFCNNATGECSARDPEGHGSHTASTAAGSPVASAPIFGIDRGAISGLAPGARVIMFRVCLEQGCFPSDSVGAVEQAIEDGVDVLNYSISGGGNAYADAVELAFLDAFNAGISVNASAGNSGPGAATADHGGPWVTTVGASTSPRTHRSTAHLVASNGDTFDLVGSTITLGRTAAPVVLATAIDSTNADCSKELPAGSAAGKIVVCVRSPGRVMKGYNVMNAGGVGMILINPINEPAFIMTDNHWVPAIHANGPPTALLAFINGHSGVTASWASGVKTAWTPDAMTQFSSRGPLGDFVKPDVTAPGLQILAAMTPEPNSPVGGPPGEYFQVIGGTSMSSPHSAGVSALVKAAHPDWTPAMIKSAMMTSAAQGVLKEDILTPADPFDAGAGSIRANRAVNPTLVFDETFADFVASASDPLHRIDLNLASVNAPTMTGLITTKRTAINVSGSDQTLDVSTEAPPGAEIIVSDKAPGAKGPAGNSIHLRKNGPTDIWITISAPALASGQYFGRITLDPRKKGANDVTIPVAFKRQQGVVTLTHSCSPTTFARNTGSSHCTVSATNLSSIAATTDIIVREKGVTKAKADNLRYTNIGAPGSPIGTDAGVRWHGTLSASVPPTVDSITPGGSPAGGYLPLSLFGVPPVAGVGDDTITNFDVPLFYWGGEPYTQLGVGSNGTLVIGGGSGADATPFPQTMPNTARPNNVVAPFWTDLNPAAAGGVRIATLTDGDNTWIVVDWEAVRNFSNTTAHSFQIWVRIDGEDAGTGPASEEVTLAYGTIGTGDPGTGTGHGAENRTGTSGVNFTPASDTDWTVNTSPPLPGGSVTIPFDVWSSKAGTFDSIASLTSNVTPGTTQEVATLTVTP
jgi:subtilisin family serine protease